MSYLDRLLRRSTTYVSGNPNRVPEALTAAGFRVTHTDTDQLRRLIQPWQTRSFSYYDQLGEIKYASQFYSRMLAPLRLYAAKRDENGLFVEIDAKGASGDDASAIAALDRIQDPGGGRETLLSAYGRLMFLTGECYLLCSRDPDTGEEQWEALSTDELRIQSGVYTRYRAPSLQAEQLHEAADDDFEPLADDEAVAYRLWQRHPRYSMLADSTMMGVLDLCVAEKSLVSTRRGPIPIEEIEVGDEVFTWTADGLKPNPVVRVCDRGDQEVVKITAGRRTIRATADHPVLVLRKSKPGKGYLASYDPEWVPVGDLRVGDHLVALDHLPDYGTDQVLPDGTPVTEDVAWLLGQIVGDGHVHAEGFNIAVYNEERRDRIRAIVGETWGLVDHPQGGNARFYSRALRRTLARVGLRVYSHEKRIPAEVLAAPAAIKRAFLAGYEEADGHLTKKGWQSLALTSERLARELRSLYIELGENVSNLAIEERAAVMVMPGGYTTENARPLHRFQVYYGSTRRGAKGVLQAKESREKIGGDHFTLATVKRIEIEGVVATYDLEVRGAHNYVADGVVSHNCEELLLLTRAVRARARSRLAGSGLLAISEDFSHSPLEPTADEDPDVDPFLADLRDAMIAPIANEGAASQIVPIVVRGPTAAIKDGIRHIQIVDPTQLYPETGLRTECIHRIALGLDMPPEILEGLQDSNHWTAWQIDDQTWTAHGMPKADQLVNDLTQAYFRPELRSLGMESAEYAIGYDAAAVVNQPDKLKDALDLFDRVIVGKQYVRESGGIPDDAAPTDEERAERIGIIVRDSSLAWFGTPAPRGGAVETAPGEITSDVPGDQSTTPSNGSGSSSIEPGAPDPAAAAPTAEPVTASGRRNGEEALALARIAGAADLAVLRSRESAGNKIRSLVKNDPEAKALIDGVPARDVAATLGAERVRALGLKELVLVADAMKIFRETLRLWRIEDDERAALIVEQIERHAARTLYDARPTPLPLTFQRYVGGVFARAS